MFDKSLRSSSFVSLFLFVCRLELLTDFQVDQSVVSLKSSIWILTSMNT